MNLEAAAVERDDVIDLVQFMDFCAEPFREKQIVGRQLVLGVVCPQPMLQLPQEMQPVRRGPTPPK